MSLHEYGNEHPSPLGRLTADHELIRRAVTLLDHIVRCLETDRPIDRSTQKWLDTFFLEFVDDYHHRKEETGLFPALEQAGMPREDGPVGAMIREHEHGRDALRRMSMILDDRQHWMEAARDYASFLRAHLEKENRFLFPMAEYILSDDVKQGILEQFQRIQREHLDSDRYRQLVNRLCELEIAHGIG